MLQEIQNIVYRQCLSLEKHDNAQSFIISSSVLTLMQWICSRVLYCYIYESIAIWSTLKI